TEGNRTGIRIYGLGCALGGAVFLGLVSWPLAGNLATPQNPETTMSVTSNCDNLYGGSYLIRVRGAEYWCTGADARCASESIVEVTYDRNNPSRCRRSDRVGRLSRFDWYSIGRYGGIFVMGLGCVLIREVDENRVRHVV